MTCHLTPTGGDLRANIEGLLKKFRVTKENEKESEIFTLANLDNGCIRKFIVKKVDESAFLASINRRNKEDSKSLTDENENTAVVGAEEGGDGCPLVPPSPRLPRRHVDAQPLANGHATPLERKSSSNFKLGCDDDSDDDCSMTVEDKDDPGVINPAFSYEEDDDDDLGRGDGSTTSARSSPDTSPSQSPKLNFGSMSPRPSPRHSPVSHRSGNLSHRSSVSSVRKGILKKSGSSSTINMEMVNLGLQNAAIAAGNAANLNGYQRARFTDPYDDNFVPMDTHRFVGSSEENNYAMQQKSLGGHRVKFILETGKPDHVHGSYDDIRIEKMERERIERIESGKNLEVTNMTDRGGKKCLLFCAAMLVLTGAVIVAGLYGSGKLKTLRDYGKGISSGLSGGATNQPATSQPSPTYVPNAIEGKFKIDNHEFTQELTDVDSEEYKKLAKDLEAELRKTLFPEPVLHNGKAILNLKIIKFEPGSIKVTFRVGWTYYDAENQQEAPLNLTAVRQNFENRIVNNTLYLLDEEYRVPPDSIVIDRLVDKCHNNRSLCSNDCKFYEDILRFICTCPDHLLLINTTTCIYPNQTTTTSTTEVSIKSDFNQILQNAGGATLVSIKQEDIGIGIEAPPTEEEEEEETEGDAEPKPEDGTVDGTASNVTLNATSEEPPPTNATDVTTSTTTNTTTTTMTPASPGSNETVSEVSSINATDVTNITTTTPATSEVQTNTTGNATITEAVPGQEEQPATTTKKAASEEVTVSPEEPEQPGGVDVANTTVTSENTTAVDAATEPSSLNVTAVTSDPASVTTTTEHSTKEGETGTKQEEGTFDELPVLEVVTNTTHHSNISIIINGTEYEVPPHSLINDSSLFPEIYVSPGTRLEDIKSFTNLPGKKVIILDLSALRPGDSPGNVGLQEMEEAMGGDAAIPDEKQSGTSVEEETLSHNTTSPPPDAAPPEAVSEASSTVTAASAVTESTTTQATEKPAVVVNANEIPAHRDTVESKPVEEELLKEVVTIPAVPYEGNPIFANKTPPSVRTTTTTTTTTTTASPSTTAAPTTTTATPTTPASPTTQVPAIEVNNVTQAASTTTTQDYDTKGEEAPVDSHPSIFDAIFSASSDLSSMKGNTTSDGDLSTTTTTTTTTTAATTTTTAGSTNSSETHHSAPSEAESSVSSSDSAPKVLCSEDQVECTNGTSPLGRCIPRSARCNSVMDCTDESDELDCKENNCFGNFQCQDGECIERLYVCDGVTNCRDGDDELSCESWECKEDELKCGGGAPSPCIPLSLRCDGQPDCADHSDELNCTEMCPGDEFRCREGWCIPKARTCDGRPDCHAGEDEEDCECSGLDETPCDVGGCVPTFQLCDGLRQCNDGSDEWNCVRIDNRTRQLEVRSGKSRWSAVCGEGWTTQWSDLVCELLGAAYSVSTEVKRVAESVPRPRVKLSQKTLLGADISLQYVLKSDCSSDNLVHLSCEHHSCGSWSLKDEMLEEHQLSAGEQPPATEGQWPSLALLLRTHPNKNDTHAQGQYCSATIVAPSWVLAAYTCLSSKENGMEPSTWAMVSGVASPTGSTEFHHVTKILPFPGMVRTGGLWTGDAVLLRLKKPLVLGPNTQPVCVPDVPPRSTARCVVTGWTRSHDGLGGQSQFLHYLPVPTLALDACNTTHYPGRLNPTHTCVGFSVAQHAPCHGDEGSPLMCRSESGAWRLEGLLTHHARCGRAGHPAIFTALHALQPWLSNTIGTPYVPSLPHTSTITTTTTTTTTTTPASTTVLSSTTTVTSASTSTTPPSSTATSDTISVSAEGNGAANSTELKDDLPPLSSPGKAPL